MSGLIPERCWPPSGVGDGIRCALTRYVRPLTGGYYTVPSVEALARFAPEDPGD